MNRMSVQEKLGVNKFELDEEHSHITVDNAKCQALCTDRMCLRVCPAEVYTEQEDGTIIVDYAACLECGTCQVACPHEALTWEYPRGGFGIIYRYG
jgi:ferredoxin like protein